ncbi:Uncharacterized conserved protein [Plasmopara halstedii]|uniref:Uncharacterized conserved protein n=1 Tax=Plasmopara halstedii TaxID=4781 RepID=A0A0P1AZ06_PLAHL|nr:Uncharacterized conserved protein [Plasmopara halstedii]CEG47695.1 Uncharacterized conserved protein [Plasmopara halstedii]|eukprot:XP_024584064.1 Uncharacterized conserved protein [Plasmopara halstedii]
MPSKLEYLQRYLSDTCRGTADGGSKKKKKSKKSRTAESLQLGSRMVDVDHAWEQSAPCREEIEKNWEMDAADDELPLVVATDNGEQVDPQDLPVFVDSDKYLGKIHGTTNHQNISNDEDLSPPRKKAFGRIESKDNASSDASPRLRHYEPARTASSQKSITSASEPHNEKHTHRHEGEKQGRDASSSRISRPSRVKLPRADDASPPRKPRQDSSESINFKKIPHDHPIRSTGHPDHHHHVDSLGRDIPSLSNRNKRRSRSTSFENKKDSKRCTKIEKKKRGTGRASRDASPTNQESKARQRRSRSPRSRHRNSRSRSPSTRQLHFSMSSKRISAIPRHRSRMKDSRRECTRCETQKNTRSECNHDARSGHTAAQISPSRDPELKLRDSATQQLEMNDKPKRANDGKKAGLFTAAEFERQREVAAKQKDVLRGVDSSEMGANAETVYRDKRGRKLDMLNELVRQQEVLDGKRKRKEREEYEWGTGEVQKRERKSQQELLEKIKKAPFARHEDDEELERMRRERKKKEEQEGYRWDGVVRGTNWEEKIMMRQNANAAVSEEAYKYAVADM